MDKVTGISSKEALIDFVDHAPENVEYLFFWGHQKPETGVSKSCLSQWFEAPFESAGVVYRTAEHYMMAEKARLFGDLAILEGIIAAETPKEAKKLGRKVSGFETSLWEAHRSAIVIRGNLAKFDQNPALGAFLLGTAERVLVEASPRDRIWGIGMSASHADAQNPRLWRGLNLLGFALMAVRAELAVSASSL